MSGLQARQDFPIINASSQPLAYLDSAATSQKPQAVIDAIADFYAHDYATVHRGAYGLSERATTRYEAARGAVAKFIGAQTEEVVFTRGTTESINLVAQTFVRARLQPGDHIVLTQMEHHANIVPWQLLAKEYDLTLKIVPIQSDGTLDLELFYSYLDARCRLVTCIHVSNVLTATCPIETMIQAAKRHGIPTLIDGAQAVAHQAVDFAKLDCDFYVFSGHKLYGPSGIGVLVAKAQHLATMAPYQGGGSMIEQVSFDHETTFMPAPWRFEAGTPNIVGAIGLHAAIDYLRQFSFAHIEAHNRALFDCCYTQLDAMEAVQWLAPMAQSGAVLSFVHQQAHAHDVATILDHHGVAVRAGHHCAMPLMKALGVGATIRVSFGLYTQEQDIQALVAGLKAVSQLFQAV